MDRTSVRTFPLKVLWCVLDQEGKKSSHLQESDGDVCVSIAHCKKVVFTFLPFTFLPFSLSFSYTHSQYPLQVLFQSVSGKAIFFIDSFLDGY